jgi:hypothetical protein
VNDIITLATYQGKQNPKALLTAYRQVAENNGEVRFGHLKDRHWEMLNKAFPRFKLDSPKGMEKFKSICSSYHPSQETFDDLQDELKLIEENSASSSDELKVADDVDTVGDEPTASDAEDIPDMDLSADEPDIDIDEETYKWIEE